MHTAIKSAAYLLLLGGCGFVNSYEEAVYDHEPVYCYQSLAAVECFTEPHHTDKKRIVNYYGPHPSRYDEPDEPDVPELQAPKAIERWVKDPEPVPQPAMKMASSKKPAPPVEETPRSDRLSTEDAVELEKMRFTEPQPPTEPASPQNDEKNEVVVKMDGEI